mgnify:CR=1 FL=1
MPQQTKNQHDHKKFVIDFIVWKKHHPDINNQQNWQCDGQRNARRRKQNKTGYTQCDGAHKDGFWNRSDEHRNETNSIEQEWRDNANRAK